MENFFSEKYIITSDCIFESAQMPSKVCQDYSICGDAPFPFLILSDGCSSSKDTDIGSRILTHVAKSLILTLSDYYNFGNVVISESEVLTKKLCLSSSCLDSTLIVAFITNDICHIVMHGDGHIFTTNKKGDLKYHQKISYDLNAPYYLSYKLNSQRDELYRDSFNSEYIGQIKIFSGGSSRDYPLIIDQTNYTRIHLDDTEYIIISSDGVESFFNFKTCEKISEEEVIQEIINIKSKTGNFVKRRVRRMLETYESKGIHNLDDLSVAAFLVKENN